MLRARQNSFFISIFVISVNVFEKICITLMRRESENGNKFYLECKLVIQKVAIDANTMMNSASLFVALRYTLLTRIEKLDCLFRLRARDECTLANN